MAMKYPLYDELLQRVQSQNKGESTGIDIKSICATINGISLTHSQEEANDHYEEIQALILHHELISNKGILLSSIPFDGKVMAGGKGALYHITKLPPILQQIISEYIENPNSST